MSDSIYEKAPKGPNFLLIVILFGVAILVVMVLALLVFKKEGKKMVPHDPNPEPNSRLWRPAPPAPATTIRVA